MNDDTYFGPFLHQVTGKAQGNVIGILILMQFHLSYFADSSRIGSSMSADHIEASALQAVRGHLHIGKFPPEEAFTNSSFFIGGRLGRSSGRSPFPQRGKHIFHSQLQLLFSAQTLLVQPYKLIIIGFSRTLVPLQKSRDALTRFGCGIFSLGRDIKNKKSAKEESQQTKYTFHIPVIRHLFVVGSRFSAAKL